VVERSLCATYRRVLLENHPVLAGFAFGSFDPVVPKYIRVQLLGLQMLWLMAAEALLYMMLYPDLGCDAFLTETDCIRMTSPCVLVVF
jgi:hypothetical protein